MFGKLGKLTSQKPREKVRDGQAESNLFARRALVGFIGVSSGGWWLQHSYA